MVSDSCAADNFFHGFLEFLSIGEAIFPGEINDVREKDEISHFEHVSVLLGKFVDPAEKLHDVVGNDLAETAFGD